MQPAIAVWFLHNLKAQLVAFRLSKSQSLPKVREIANARGLRVWSISSEDVPAQFNFTPDPQIPGHVTWDVAEPMPMQAINEAIQGTVGLWFDVWPWRVINMAVHLGGAMNNTPNEVLLSLREHLREWTEWDEAAFFLGKLLGILPEHYSFGNAKGSIVTKYSR